MEDSQGETVRYFAASASENGVPSVSYETTTLDYASELPEGYAQVRQIQAGTCASEFFYFSRRSPTLPSRFELDLANIRKQEYYLSRNREAGIIESEDALSRLKEVMSRSMFHEGFCRITESKPRMNAPSLPILQFVPEYEAGRTRFVKRIVPLTLESNLESGRLAVRNPSYVCDAHSRADYPIRLQAGRISATAVRIICMWRRAPRDILNSSAPRLLETSVFRFMH